MNRELSSLALQRRDAAIVSMLVERVPVASLQQIADYYFNGDRSNSVRTLKRLLDRQLIASCELLGRTPPVVNAPLIAWKPGENAPSFARIQFLLSQRWLSQGVRKRTCFTAGPMIRKLLGWDISDQVKRPLQASHELGLTACYIQFVRTRLAAGETWIGEHFYESCEFSSVASLLEIRTQRPDALILHRDGNIRLAVEYGGLYNMKRLDRFHRFCKARSLAYELW